MSKYHEIYQAGIADERRVIEYLSKQFPNYPVRPSTLQENRDLDIDCWVGIKPVSIKAQHSGAYNQSIYFELVICPHGIDGSMPWALDLNVIEDLVTQGWKRSWWFNGFSEIYAILQINTLYLYNKSDILDYVETNGFDRLRPLSAKAKAYQVEGNHYHSNAICGYLPLAKVRHCKLELPALAPARARVDSPKRRSYSNTNRLVAL